MMKASSVEEMRNLDRTAIEQFGISEELLMENAGEAAYFTILNEVGISDKIFAIICGSGNNGGDGLVVARKIHSMGAEARVFLLGEENRFRGAAKKNFEIISGLPISLNRIEEPKSLQQELQGCDAIVDAIFGTGLMRDVEGKYREVIEAVNESGKTVISVDIPSGINGDTGGIKGIAVKADYTVTFGLPKLGNLLYPGFAHCGKLFVTHISFPPSLHDDDSLKIEINHPAALPERKQNGYKGTFGDVLFIAGASNYFGAPYFSALSFLKAGGGYSRLASPASVTPVIAAKGSEIVFAPQEETSSGSIAFINCEELLELSGKVDMVVMGPGLSLDGETQELVRHLAKEIRKPLLVDGDGITALADQMEIVSAREEPTVLTPHLGEMSKISHTTISRLDENKVNILQKEAGRLGAVIVLKGAHTLIGYPDERIFVNMSGNSGMASAGSGDVLTGTIAAMFGLGLPLEDAARTGVFLHGYSGDLAAREKGEDGITAQDILDFLPGAVRSFRTGREEIISDCYDSVHLI
jgi:NAD(P)H-hydrate epimerase